MRSDRGVGRYISVLGAVGLAASTVITGIGSVAAAGERDAKREQAGSLHRPGAPMLAVVALAEQRVTIYDAEGMILQAPVSTGTTGLETPAGIYSVVQKKAEHHSNIYEDGSMPFMQRITWTGIALHGGVLPGYPASHGCVRMPMEIAQHLFGMTDLGLRVIIVREDIEPTDIRHPLLFKPNAAHVPLAPVTQSLFRPSGRDQGAQRIANDIAPLPGSARYLQVLKSIAAAKSQEAAAAASKAGEAKSAAARRAAEAAAAAKSLRTAEADASKADTLLKAAERALETATSPQSLAQAGQAKEKAVAKLAQAQAQLESAKAQSQARIDAAGRARDAAAAAEAAKEDALEAANGAVRKMSPISVFISRKTQRLYVRQGFQPVFEGPIAIRDADKPIGTYVFTARSYRNDGAEVRWSVVSMYKNENDTKPVTQGQAARKAEAAPADVVGAMATLDRIGIAPEARERISEIILPGSSLIVSDEGAHIETGKDTDFVVLLSGEPQGGIKSRRREFGARPRGDGYFFGSPFGFRLF
jgi:L,D-transpeptidase catalytic domain